MFFNFRQNNSGGVFFGPKNVVVRASNHEEANQKAVDSGMVYFHGVRDGKDCDCCGDRWYKVQEFDATETPCKYEGIPYDIPDLDSEYAGEVVIKFDDFSDKEDFAYVP